MHPLEKRIAALESVNPPSEEMTIIIKAMSPVGLNSQIHRLRDDDGKLWTRLPGETEQALIDRASLEAKRSPWGVARLISDDAEVVPC